MVASALGCALRGVAGVPIHVEADVANGLPSFTVVGLTDRAIQEARERVRAALRNGGFDFPQRRITVNLAPAEIPKEGTGFDLAIALAILACLGRRLDLAGTAAVGELALDAAVRPVLGVLPMARSLRAAGVRRLLVAPGNAGEAALVEGLEITAVPTLSACVEHLEGVRRIAPAVEPAAPPPTAPGRAGDFADVRGQAAAKRALEIAAAGGHNVLMLGPPGAGKTLLARRLAGVLPDLDSSEALEVAAVYSLRGALAERDPRSLRPPFRAPHHSVSRAGLLGGGSGIAQPGELSLAHRGVLLLDELCEFPRSLLEALRQPLEERAITVARLRGTVVLPADFVLVAASNPCPCGYLDDPAHPCTCVPREIDAYRARLSGPVRDRVDLVVPVPRQPFALLLGEAPRGPTSADVRGRVEAARARARRRNAGALNGGLRGPAVLESCRVTAAATALLAADGERRGLSARAYHRVVRVARTVADLDGRAAVEADDVAEALAHRGGDGPW